MNTDILNLKLAAGDAATRPSALATLRAIAGRKHDHRQKDAARALLELQTDMQTHAHEDDEDEPQETAIDLVCQKFCAFELPNSQSKADCPVCGRGDTRATV
jgi:hypothetical protein